ncbi:MAG: histidine--tRNA ligase [Armatimonadetes bacterium]|nr:histidine--tRNA ligase [Armatimonadota bacterium]
MKFQAPRGTYDILPESTPLWRWAEATFHNVCRLYGYQEIRTPAFEDTALFVRGIGEGTDMVSKEMYNFEDRSGRKLTLKPEETAPAIRAYLEHSLGGPDRITRLYYITPIFRYERPQHGRQRQSHQTGVELIGSPEPDADAEVIELTVRWYRELGLDNVSVKLNSLGMEECRKAYWEALLEYAAPLIKEFKQDFRERCERNPLRLLDSKDEEIQKAMHDAPTVDAFLETESRDHYDAVKERLQALNVLYEEDTRLVRGLDYYTKTVFEVQSESLGAQNALCGGGRYDNLIEDCGGPATPAVGVAMGIERALMVLKTENRTPNTENCPHAFAVCLTGRRSEFAKVVQSLRNAGVSVETDPNFRSAKSQFRQADKSGATIAVVIGDMELDSDEATVKDLQQGTEQKIAMGTLAQSLRNRAVPAADE